MKSKEELKSEATQMMPSFQYELIDKTEEERDNDNLEMVKLRTQLKQKFDYKNQPADEFKKQSKKNGEVGKLIEVKMKEKHDKMQERLANLGKSQFAS